MITIGRYDVNRYANMSYCLLIAALLWTCGITFGIDCDCDCVGAMI